MSIQIFYKVVTALLLLQIVSGGRQEVLVYDELADCGNSESIAHVVNPKIITIKPSGLTTCRLDTDITKNSEVKWLKVNTSVCDTKRQNCIQFVNWKKDNEDVCPLATKKDTIWSPFFAVQPPLECPVIKKGLYHLQNGTLDISKISLLSIPNNKYLRVKVELMDSKKKPFLCVVLGAMHRFIGRQ